MSRGPSSPFPTYAFVVLCGGLVVVGVVRWVAGRSPADGATGQVTAQGGSATFAFIFVLLRAFSGGCSAMTGTEAISNAVPAFKPPESRNAGHHAGHHGRVLAFLLMGVTALAQSPASDPIHGRQHRSSQPGGHACLRTRRRSSTTPCRSPPWPSCSWAPTPAYAGFPACPPCSRATASCPASS